MLISPGHRESCEHKRLGFCVQFIKLLHRSLVGGNQTLGLPPNHCFESAHPDCCSEQVVDSGYFAEVADAACSESDSDLSGFADP